MNKLNLKQAIETMAKAGFTFDRKQKCEYSGMMDYYFTKEGLIYTWTLPGLRIRAEREEWVMYLEECKAKLKRGVQMSLFTDWEVEEMCAS